MTESTPDRPAKSAAATHLGEARTSDRPRWETPRAEVISLSCEISAYAPDDADWPLF